MSAAALDSAELGWRLASGSTADIQEEPEPTPGLVNQKRFIPPVRQGNVAVTLESIEVSCLSGGPVQKTIAVVIHQPSTYFFRTEKVTNSLLLKFFYLNKEGDEVRVPLHETTFTKLYGEGLLSHDGRYDPPTSPTTKFAVLMAEREDDEEWKFAYLIVPLPLVNVQDIRP
ncbi:hypothetical protein B1218_29075 [Pseudomonas ogarae]|nr:hypothetical protein B1218_29075 [Pseudomonas ogarae]